MSDCNYCELRSFAMDTPHKHGCPGLDVEKLNDRNDVLEDALHQIRSWCKAYPIGVFPEPDWSEVRKELGDRLLTRVSASNMRHVVSGVDRIISATVSEGHKND